MPELVLMPAPVMTTTFRDFKSASAICWRSCSASGRTSMVGMVLHSATRSHLFSASFLACIEPGKAQRFEIAIVLCVPGCGMGSCRIAWVEVAFFGDPENREKSSASRVFQQGSGAQLRV